MKKFYFSTIFLLVINFLFANPVITAKQTGSWSSSNTWDKARTPNDGDTIIIPAGKIVSFDDFLSTETLKNVYIKVYGTLRLAGLLSTLSLDNNSTIAIYPGGLLSSTGVFQSVTLAGQQIFASGSSSISGPKMVNSGSNGFISFSPLPVKFVGFSLTQKGKDVLIQWSTSEEINTNSYEIERSIDGNNWSSIGYVFAAGNSATVKNYTYIDKSLSYKIAYYRIKEVDIDGKTSFTSIKLIRQDPGSTANDINIASIQGKIVLQFQQQVSGNVSVRFVSSNGQVVDQQVISNPLGQVVLNSKVSGSYIISVTNGQQINTAKKVIL